jgi:quinol monooxygenase YgiN
MTLLNRAALALPALLFFFMNSSFAQAPAAPATPASTAPAASSPPAIPADVSPLYVVTYVEAKLTSRDEAAALLKAYCDASRAAPGNMRSIVVQRVRRPGQFVIVAAWKDKAAWDVHMAATGTKEFRDKLSTMRSAPTDDRFHNALSVGSMDDPQVPGAVYAVTHVDVIPPRRDDAVAALKVLGEANRNAGSNVRYEVVQQTNRPNHFTVFEIWRSRDAFEANSMAPAQREFRDKLAQMTGALYDERLYEILN